MARVVFLGQKWLGDRCFDLLVGGAPSGVEVVGAVSNANADTWWGSDGVRESAVAAGLPFVANELRHTDEVEALVRRTDADLLLSVQHPWIIPQSTLDLVEGRALNVHSAKLPEYGGHNATNHAILDGATSYTVTAHWMAAEVDAGPIALEETFPMPPGVHARGLYELALGGGAMLFARLLELVASDEVPSRPLAAPPLVRPRSSLDALRDTTDLAAEERELRARALFFPPFEPAYVRAGDRKVHLLPAGAAPYLPEFRGRFVQGWSS